MSNVGRTASKNWLSLLLIFLFTFSISLAGGRLVRAIIVGWGTSSPTNDTDIENTSTTPKPINLQAIVEDWAQATFNETDQAENLSIIVYDLDRSENIAELNPDQTFPLDTLIDLLLAYNGYHQISASQASFNDPIIESLNLGDCLDLLVRESSPTCHDAMLADEIWSQGLITFTNSFGIATVDGVWTASATSYARALQHIWQHTDLDLISWARLQDSLLNQPTSEDTNWRAGLAHGFSTAQVYSKTSRELDPDNNQVTYLDSAIVDFTKQDRHFIVVAFAHTNIDQSDLSRLGTLIEGKVLEEYQ